MLYKDYNIIAIKNKNLEEYYRIKVNAECVFLFLLNSKNKYTY